MFSKTRIQEGLGSMEDEAGEVAASLFSDLRRSRLKASFTTSSSEPYRPLASSERMNGSQRSETRIRVGILFA